MKAFIAIGFALGVVFAAPSAYLLGDFTGSQETQRVERLQASLDEARAQRDAAHIDLGAATLMATLQKETADTNREAARIAEEQAHEYAEELAKRGDGMACALTPADLGRLRKYEPPAAPPAKPSPG